MKILAENNRIKFDYQILESYEAGIVLYGFEVKAIKSGHVSLKGAYVVIKDEEAHLLNAFIPPYQEANTPPDYDPRRSRKLLFKKSEIKTLIGRSKIKGLTLVPIRMYTGKSKYSLSKNKIKLEIGVAKSKKEIDKRETIKKREVEREIRRVFRGKIRG